MTVDKYVLFRMTGKIAGKTTYRILVVVPRRGFSAHISIHGEAVGIAEEWQRQMHPNMPRAHWTAYPRPQMGDPLEAIYGRETDTSSPTDVREKGSSSKE